MAACRPGPGQGQHGLHQTPQAQAGILVAGRRRTIAAPAQTQLLRRNAASPHHRPLRPPVQGAPGRPPLTPPLTLATCRPWRDVAGVAMTTRLIDKVRAYPARRQPGCRCVATRIERGLVRITTVTRLEAGYSVRSGPDLRSGFARPPLSSMAVECTTPAIEDRAVEVLTLLADRGQHRAPSIPDLIIDATAELAGLTVRHLGKDFDVIADVTCQPVERLNVR